MKKTISTLILAGLLALSAHAGLQPLNLGTNTVAGSTATNFSSLGTLSTVNSGDSTLQVSSTSTAADTSNKIWVFNGSVDNAIWTTNVLAITYASTGTTVASGITNLPPGFRYPFLQLFYTTNAAASAGVTNLNAKLFTKTGI